MLLSSTGSGIIRVAASVAPTLVTFWDSGEPQLVVAPIREIAVLDN